MMEAVDGDYQTYKAKDGAFVRAKFFDTPELRQMVADYSDDDIWNLTAKHEPKVDVRVVASSKMVDAGALDSGVLTSNLDLRDDTSGVEIHLGLGDYPGYRADKLFDVSVALVASPELNLKSLDDLKTQVLLHDDAMDLVAGGDAWRKWLEAARVADRIDGSRGPHFSSNILSLEAASQKLGVALALKPLVNADIASGRLCAPFGV